MLKQVLSLSVASAIAFTSLPAFSAEQLSTINIRATGTVSAAPDMAVITSGVVTEGKTARAALSENNTAMAALIDVLKAANVDEKHIQTSGFSVQPNYVHSDKRDQNGYMLPPKISGYRVSNMVRVQVVELDDLGDVLDQAITVGANSINGVSFAVSNPNKLLDDARKQAIAEAIKNANIYADAADFELKRILNISENAGYTPQPYAGAARMEMAMADSVPVQAGELDYSITVNVQWEISE